MLEKAAFTDIGDHDVTDNTALIPPLCRAARPITPMPSSNTRGADAFASFQEFLAVVAALATDRRLSRLAYVARRAVVGAHPHYPNQDGSATC